MLELNTVNEILIDGKNTGLKLIQRSDGTVIYTPDTPSLNQKYKEHPMPYGRYSAVLHTPHKTGEEYDPRVCAGSAQLEHDIRTLLAAHAATTN